MVKQGKPIPSTLRAEISRVHRMGDITITSALCLLFCGLAPSDLAVSGSLTSSEKALFFSRGHEVNENLYTAIQELQHYILLLQEERTCASISYREFLCSSKYQRSWSRVLLLQLLPRHANVRTSNPESS